MSTEERFDVIAIGSGPAGQRAAIQAAKLGRRVALVERESVLGGVSANTGTLPSKTVRTAVIELTGLGQRAVYGDAYRVKEALSHADVRARADHVVGHEQDLVRDQLRRNGVTIVSGSAAFVDPHTLDVTADSGRRRLVAGHIVIAVGTTPARPDGVDFADPAIIDADGLGALTVLPRALTVVGGGVIGLEYASMAAAMGVRVTVVERGTRLLPFVDAEIAEALAYHLRDLGVTLRLGEAVTGVERRGEQIVTRLRSGKQVPSDLVLYAAGRQAATAGLGLEAAGLAADARGRLRVDDEYRTAQPHIYAVGDVIGFPALTATSLEQGRLAGRHASGAAAGSISDLMPYGIYTIPEISVVGRNEEELTEAGVPYVEGRARYRELARGDIAGDRHGLLKLLVDPETLQLLGVHVIGTTATEIIHIGQTVMAGRLPLDYLVDAVFNYPTFSDAYKIAALDAANRLGDLETRAAA